jgi:hypothetical protein
MRKTDALNQAAAVNGQEPVDQTNAPARAFSFSGPNLDPAARLSTIAFTPPDTSRRTIVPATRASCGG